jgi:hypothetical protein
MKMKSLNNKIKSSISRIYVILNASKSDTIVWKKLEQMHKKSGWKFKRYEDEKTICRYFYIDDSDRLDFAYTIKEEKLLFRAMVLPSFDEEITNAILVLASHFNGLLSFGIVKVNVKDNCVEMRYSRDLLAYALSTENLEVDIFLHCSLAQDCRWAFTTMIETGENPVFVFSDFLEEKKRRTNMAIEQCLQRN